MDGPTLATYEEVAAQMSGLTALAPELASDLAAVERQIRRVLADRSALATKIALHTVMAGGKRLRPALCLMAGRFGEADRIDFVRRAAAGMELVHIATLVHDDVIDRSPTRRGKPTAAARWGSGMAVLAGDFLFSSSFNLLYDEDDPTVLRLAARMVRHMCAGAIEEVESAGRLDQDLSEYYRRIYRKTAVFLETACRAGALASRAPDQVTEALARYGRLVGLAFQVVDDVLDFTGDPARTGKPVGGDLRNGLLTLPMIYAREDDAARVLLDRSFGRQRTAATTLNRLITRMHACGAIERSLAEALRLAQQGVEALEPLKGLGPVEPLQQLAIAAITRDR